MKKLFSSILFLGVCFSHWTAVTPLKKKLYVYHRLDSIEECTVNESLRYDRILEISADAFENCTNLKSLDLSYNKLRELESRTFSKLQNLEQLLLRKNKIKSMKDPFVGLNKLKYLDLSHNPTISFAAGSLFGLTNSTKIYTYSTEIEFISSRAFEDETESDESEESGECQDDDDDDDDDDDGNDEEEENTEYYNPNIKICKTDDGLVTSIGELKSDEELGNCIAEIAAVETKVLNLTNLGLKEFQKGWYQLPGNYFEAIDFAENLITEITPQLLNDLPSNLTDIYLDSNKITEIKKNVIDNIFIKTLNFTLNPLSKIEDGAFERTSLTYFGAAGAKLNNINFVKTLPKTIEQFDLNGNPFVELPVDTFRGFKNLTYLQLNDTKIRRIEPGTFEDQENLQYVYIEDNEITELHPGIFEGLKKLEVISFENNKITKISRDTFSELKNLGGLSLFLGDNRISIIEEGSFSNMNLSTLDLSYNSLDDHSMAVGTFDTSTIEMIDFEGNYIEKINDDLFEGILSSYELDFTYNSIRTIKKGDVEKMGKCSLLTLDKNPLTQLENGALYGLSKEEDVYVYLENTPIHVIQGGLFDDV